MISVDGGKIRIEGYVHENILDLIALFAHFLEKLAEDDKWFAKGAYDGINLTVTKYLKDRKGINIDTKVDEINGTVFMAVMMEAGNEHEQEKNDAFAKLLADAIDNADWKGE
jgi:hypothetical protein